MRGSLHLSFFSFKLAYHTIFAYHSFAVDYDLLKQDCKNITTVQPRKRNIE